jgi:hypothetical protein
LSWRYSCASRAPRAPSQAPGELTLHHPLQVTHTAGVVEELSCSLDGSRRWTDLRAAARLRRARLRSTAARAAVALWGCAQSNKPTGVSLEILQFNRDFTRVSIGSLRFNWAEMRTAHRAARCACALTLPERGSDPAAAAAAAGVGRESTFDALKMMLHTLLAATAVPGLESTAYVLRSPPQLVWSRVRIESDKRRPQDWLLKCLQAE